MENEKLQELFNRYLEQKASPQEVQQLLHYFQLNEESPFLHQLIIRHLESHQEDDNIISLRDNEVYKRVEDKLSMRITQEQSTTTWRKPMIRAFAMAAAIVLFITGYVLWNYKSSQATNTVYANYGKLLEVQLPDSSKVWLNAGTTITYARNFNGKKRIVFLKNGEAFFDVIHKHTPFIVKTRDADIVVLGTSFNVADFDKDKKMGIAVSTGKVGVEVNSESNHKPTFLIAGERAVITKSNHLVHLINVPVSDIAVWREQRLIFDEQPLAEAMERLERKYNVHIEIQNPQLLTAKVSMRLNNQPLTDVLTAISFANHFNYEKVNDQLIVIK